MYWENTATGDAVVPSSQPEFRRTESSHAQAKTLFRLRPCANALGDPSSGSGTSPQSLKNTPVSPLGSRICKEVLWNLEFAAHDAPQTTENREFLYRNTLFFIFFLGCFALNHVHFSKTAGAPGPSRMPILGARKRAARSGPLGRRESRITAIGSGTAAFPAAGIRSADAACPGQK